MLTVLDGLAEFERELIKARTGEGRASCRSILTSVLLASIRALRPLPLKRARVQTKSGPGRQFSPPQAWANTKYGIESGGTNIDLVSLSQIAAVFA